MRSRIVVLAVLVEAGLGLVALAIGMLAGIEPYAGIGSSAYAGPVGAAATVPLLLLLAIVTSTPWEPFRRLTHWVETWVVPLFRGCRWPSLLLIALAAGIGEELLFRGLLQTWLAFSLANQAIAVVAASVVFGLMHAVTTTYAVLATVIGLYLGWLHVATGDLLVPMIAHALYDHIALVYLTRRVKVGVYSTS